MSSFPKRKTYNLEPLWSFFLNLCKLIIYKRLLLRCEFFFHLKNTHKEKAKNESSLDLSVCFLAAGLARRNPTDSPAFHLATAAWGSSTQLCPAHGSDPRGHGRRPAARRLEASALRSSLGDVQGPGPQGRGAWWLGGLGRKERRDLSLFEILQEEDPYQARRWRFKQTLNTGK